MEFVCQQNEQSFLCLRESLKARKRIILQNDAFLGAVYVDLRYHRLLSVEQKERAKRYILLTWRKLVHLHESQELSMVSPTSSPHRNFRQIQIHHTLLEAILIQKDSEISVNEKVDSKDEVVLAGVETLANAPLIPKSQDIFKYWANHYNQQLGEVFSRSAVFTNDSSICEKDFQRP